MKHANKVIIVGRKVNIYAKTDVAATIRRVQREREAEARETAKVVRPIAQRKVA